MQIRFTAYSGLFAEIANGTPFLFGVETKFIGVKAQLAEISGAVIMQLKDGAVVTQPFFETSQALETILLLALPDLYMEPSKSIEYMNLTGGVDYMSGNIYLFPKQRPFLAFSHGQSKSLVSLLDVESGE